MEVERVTWMATLPLRRPLGVFCHVAPAGQPGGSVTGVWWEVLTDRECVVWGKALGRMIRNSSVQSDGARAACVPRSSKSGTIPIGFGIAIAVAASGGSSPSDPDYTLFGLRNTRPMPGTLSAAAAKIRDRK